MYRDFRTGEPRAATWAERERIDRLREAGTEDVFVDPDDAPYEFWNVLVEATFSFVLADTTLGGWAEWARMMSMNLGLDRLAQPETSYWIYKDLLRTGKWEKTPYPVAVRLAAVEFLLDLKGGSESFNEAVNDRARWFHVGVRLDGNRFVPTTSDLLHVEVVQPALKLLVDVRFSDVDGLYRKGFDRALAGDDAGAVTAAISAVEEMFRVLLPVMEGQTLGPLAEKARAEGVISEPIEAFAKKLYGLRPRSDAHQAGKADFDLAMLALHLAGSLILYVGRSVEGTLP